MAERPENLPDFDDPPVVEVVLSVQFADLRDYRTVHAGLLWDRKFRGNGFNAFSEHPPIDPVFETFGEAGPRKVKIDIVEMPGPTVPRIWFTNANKTEIVQFQADRFIHNWRKIGPEDIYPRYEYIKKTFFKELRFIEEFIKKENIGNIEPNQCEVTYVNHIYFDDGGDVEPGLKQVLRNWSDPEVVSTDPNAGLPDFEGARTNLRFIMKDSEGNPMGRLLVTAAPAIDNDNNRIVRLDLTARGAPAQGSRDAIENFFDSGRDAIVRGFTALTTPAMHAHWKRKK